MNTSRKALWIVVAIGVAFWITVFARGAAAIGNAGGPVALWASYIVVVLVLLALAGHQINQQWLGVLIDNRNKFSLARLQIALWTVMIMSAYLVIAFARIAATRDGSLAPQYALDIKFPTELLLAMGISAASFAGATLIKQSKTTKTIAIGTKATPESAEQHRDDAKVALAAAEAELDRAVQAEKDAAQEHNEAVTALEQATDARKDEAKRQLAEKETFHAAAIQDKFKAVADHNEKTRAFQVAETDLKATLEAEGRLHRNAEPAQASWVDFFRGEEISNYKLVDMSKVQMMFFTVVVIAAYAAGIVVLLEGDLRAPNEMSFPPFDDTLNALLGISHGTYLSVKAVDHT